MTNQHYVGLLPRKLYILRLFKSGLLGLLLITLSLLVGMWGYHDFEKMSWIDAFVNAAMILSGMGPVSPLATDGGKLFAGFYALYSGLAFILIIGLVLAPMVHRLFHKYHLEYEKENLAKQANK